MLAEQTREQLSVLDPGSHMCVSAPMGGNRPRGDWDSWGPVSAVVSSDDGIMTRTCAHTHEHAHIHTCKKEIDQGTCIGRNSPPITGAMFLNIRD